MQSVTRQAEEALVLLLGGVWATCPETGANDVRMSVRHIGRCRVHLWCEDCDSIHLLTFDFMVSLALTPGAVHER